MPPYGSNGNAATATASKKLTHTQKAAARESSSVRFKPFPFNDLHQFWADPQKPFQIKGEWRADHLSGGSAALTTQVEQGHYVPLVAGETTNKPMLLFSQQEAHDCLANKRVVFAGDSYQTLFCKSLHYLSILCAAVPVANSDAERLSAADIGLTDILLGETSEAKITNRPSRFW